MSRARPPAKRRCAWAEGELMQAYHDQEWGVPVHDDRRLFEFLVLEGAQAGLSWSTILRKRAGYRDAFRGFDIAAVARFGEADVARLLADAGIVRNRAKIGSAVRNADLALGVVDEFGSLDAFLWQFVGGRTVQNRWRSFGQVPPRTAESDAMSKALRQRGFVFVGSTICYAFMQAVGMVNDHTVGCFRHPQLRGRSARKPSRPPARGSRGGSARG
jgi:DNA-3-methyladenine glycosylase I